MCVRLNLPCRSMKAAAYPQLLLITSSCPPSMPSLPPLLPPASCPALQPAAAFIERQAYHSLEAEPEPPVVAPATGAGTRRRHAPVPICPLATRSYVA